MRPAADTDLNIRRGGPSVELLSEVPVVRIHIDLELVQPVDEKAEAMMRESIFPRYHVHCVLDLGETEGFLLPGPLLGCPRRISRECLADELRTLFQDLKQERAVESSQ